jgi:hypothetical protein
VLFLFSDLTQGGRPACRSTGLTTGDVLPCSRARDHITAEGYDKEAEKERQACATLILCQGYDMLMLVEDRANTHKTLQALSANHLRRMRSFRSHGFVI